MRWAAFRPKIITYLTELVIVVFGVFLGFMANNYAEGIKENNYINATIKEMYYSLAEDISDAETNKMGHEQGIIAVKYFIKMVRNQEVSIDSFHYFHTFLTRNFISIQNMSPFETIKTKGFDGIKNDSLRRLMIKVYDFHYEILEKVEENYQESQIYVNESKNINEIFDKSLAFDAHLNLEKISIPLKITQEERSRLIIILKRIYSSRMFSLALYEDVIKDMIKLREHLAKEYPFVVEK